MMVGFYRESFWYIDLFPFIIELQDFIAYIQLKIYEF